VTTCGRTDRRSDNYLALRKGLNASEEGRKRELDKMRWRKKKYFFYCVLQITVYSIRVISKVEVRKGREAGTIHRWFTGFLLLSYNRLSRLSTEGLKRALIS